MSFFCEDTFLKDILLLLLIIYDASPRQRERYVDVGAAD